MASYRGRFAPSPTGPLHAGSLVAALASWLDARAHEGTWLVRIEDIDPPRCQPGADHWILQQLAQCGLTSDEPVVWQSQRHAHYAQALEKLRERHLAYPCACTRKSLAHYFEQQGSETVKNIERPYPGICRHGLQGLPARSWRFRLEEYFEALQTSPACERQKLPFHIQGQQLMWHDRRLGPQQQDPHCVAGDFVLQRADGLYAYQLAVVVDDALQRITHVVRGEDLTDNTPRQLLLQHALQAASPRYLHTPLVRMADGTKLSKQHGAPAVDTSSPLQALSAAAQVLGLPSASPDSSVSEALGHWVRIWQATYNDFRD